MTLLFALHESLREILEEGLALRYERHTQVSGLLITGLADLGILPFAQSGHRLPTLNAVTLPSNLLDEAGLRKQLLIQYGVEIGGGLGSLKGKIWRIGTMGSSATPRNVTLLLAALRNLMGSEFRL